MYPPLATVKLFESFLGSGHVAWVHPELLCEEVEAQRRGDDAARFEEHLVGGHVPSHGELVLGHHSASALEKAEHGTRVRCEVELLEVVRQEQEVLGRRRGEEEVDVCAAR